MQGNLQSMDPAMGAGGGAGAAADLGGGGSGYQTFGGGLRPPSSSVSFRPAAARPLPSDPRAPYSASALAAATLPPTSTAAAGAPVGEEARLRVGGLGLGLAAGAAPTMAPPAAAPAARPPPPPAPMALPSPRAARNLLLVAGALTLLLAVAAPIWDAARLLDDPAFAYYVGSTLPALLVGACLGAVLLYSIAIVAFFRLAREDAKTSQGAALVAAACVAALGVALLALSEPLVQQSSIASQELLMSCGGGVATGEGAAGGGGSLRTERLARRWASLAQHRSSPGCSEQESVELCSGFEDSYLTGVLRDFESTYHCSGFCSQWGAGSWAGLRPAASSGGAAAAAAAASAPPSRALFGGDRGPGSDAALRRMAQSCDGAAGRALKYQAIGAGQLLFSEGVALVTIGLLVAALQVGAGGGAPAAASEQAALLAAMKQRQQQHPQLQQRAGLYPSAAEGGGYSAASENPAPRMLLF